MKILYCIGALNEKGGTEKVLANKANYFADELGYDIHIIMNDQKEKELIYYFSKNIVFHDMKISSHITKPKIPLISSFFLKNKMLKIYREKIKEINPDIIIVLQHGIDSYIVPRLNLKIPIIREFHSSIEVIKYRSKLINNIVKRKVFLYTTIKRYKNFKKFDYVVYLTQNEKNKEIAKTKAVVIPNMLENISYPIADLQNEKKTVISIGSMRDMGKRFDIQIKLWKKVVKNHPEWKLKIFGEGKERKKLQRLIKELELENNVFLKGNTDNVYNELSKSDFFIFTSAAEGFGMVLIEAMACGLPCVSFDCPEGPSDIIDNNKNGFLVENNNENKFLERILALINNKEKRIQMGRESLKKSQNYLPNKIGKQWINFFNKISKK